MSKVICDVCGTSYPETSNQCPICGCVRSGDNPVVEDPAGESGGYTYVKGGRFSKANVRKRNQGNQTAKEKKPANKKALGLIIVLLCIVLIVAFMILYVLSGWSRQQAQNETTNPLQTATLPVSCTGITLSKLEIEMTAVGEIWLLEADVAPADTTDKIIFSSSDETVATVADNGKITCVGEGNAVISVSCGDQIAECKVSCVFEKETEPATRPPEGVRLNRKSITANEEGFTWVLYSGDVAVENILWTSDDPSVAVIENGVVTAVAEGRTNVHAEYNGVVTSCEIICDFEDPNETTEGGSSGNSDEQTEAGEYKLYSQFGDPIPYDSYKGAYDVTVSVGETVGLFLKNAAGEALTLNWTITEGDSCSVDENYVTVESSSTNCMLEAEHEGIIYSCYIRTVN